MDLDSLEGRGVTLVDLGGTAVGPLRDLGGFGHPVEQKRGTWTPWNDLRGTLVGLGGPPRGILEGPWRIRESFGIHGVSWTLRSDAEGPWRTSEGTEGVPEGFRGSLRALRAYDSL